MPRFRTNSPSPVGAALGASASGGQCYSPGATPPGLRVCPTACPTKAFTLLEIVVVIAIIGILGGTIAPLALQLFTSKRGEVTVDKLEEFKKAIIGNPFVIGDDVRSSFGYIGDMGSLPPQMPDGKMPEDLYKNPFTNPSSPLYGTKASPYYTYDSNKKTGAGWRGPYINPDIIEDLSILGLDAYKQQLVYRVYNPTTELDAQTGAFIVGELISKGPNREEGGAVADDRNVYIFQSETLATVSGFLKDAAGNGVAGVKVTMNYPVNGSFSLTPPVATTPSTSYFSFSNVPYGNRSITIEPKLVYAPGSARAFDENGDGINNDIELNITNLSNGDITIDKIEIWFDVATRGVMKYVELWFGGEQGNGGGGQSGGKVKIDPKGKGKGLKINGINDKSSGQTYIIRVQSPQTHIPDLRIRNYPAGDTVNMKIKGFFSTIQGQGNTPFNVSGIPFKAVLRDKTTNNDYTIYFTPNVN